MKLPPQRSPRDRVIWQTSVELGVGALTVALVIRWVAYLQGTL